MNYKECSFEYIPQEYGYLGMYKIMELAARLCYKTENLIKEGSAHRIIDEIIVPSGHTSILEFGTVYLVIPICRMNLVHKYRRDRFSRVRIRGFYAYVTTTYRTILQGDYKDPIEAINNNFDKNWKADLAYWVEPLKYHHKRYTYRFVMDRGGSQSVERHRGRYGISYAQESTRYVNYNRDKFNREITFCYPSIFYKCVEKWATNPEASCDITTKTKDEQLNFLREHDEGWKIYESSLKNAEESYMNLIDNEKWIPEDARGVLPLDIKTEFMMCAYEEDWNMFFFRRTDKHAHSQIQRISNALKSDAISRGMKLWKK